MYDRKGVSAERRVCEGQRDRQASSTTAEGVLLAWWLSDKTHSAKADARPSNKGVLSCLIVLCE